MVSSDSDSKLSESPKGFTPTQASSLKPIESEFEFEDEDEDEDEPTTNHEPRTTNHEP